MQNLENEIWKDVVGYKGVYVISNLGRIKSLERMRFDKDGWPYGIAKEKFLKPFISNHGYKQVILCNKIGKKAKTIHRLVITAFIPNSEKYPIINHKDGNKLNNCIENLEWCTYRENSNGFSKKIRTSTYPGVSKNHRTNKWVVHIMLNKVDWYLGSFNDEQKAYEVYKAATLITCSKELSAYKEKFVKTYRRTILNNKINNNSLKIKLLLNSWKVTKKTPN